MIETFNKWQQIKMCLLLNEYYLLLVWELLNYHSLEVSTFIFCHYYDILFAIYLNIYTEQSSQLNLIVI